MASETLIIVVGGDYLAFEICREILKTAGHAVVLLWKHADERAERKLLDEARELTATYGRAFRFLNEDPLASSALRDAGLLDSGRVDSARPFCLVAVSSDDRLNLRVALMARDVNEHVRITLRQFNPLLGRKIQEGLRYNCTAISPAAHAAATYAASAVDASCFYGLRVPTLESGAEDGDDGELFAFSERTADFFAIDGMTVHEAEERRTLRIVTVNGRAPYLCAGEADARDEQLLQRTFAAEDRVVAFGPVSALREAGPRANVRRARRRDAMFAGVRDAFTAMRRTEPVLRRAALAALLIYIGFVIFFGAVTHWNVWATMYFVITMMEGSPDNNLCGDCGTNGGVVALWQLVEMAGVALVTLTGLALVAIFTASITSGLYAAAVRRTQGLRRIHRSGHVIVCGAGNVGSLVVQYLRRLGERVVVVEKDPDSLLIEMARDRKIDLLTGDATNDETIAFCSPERAKSLVGVTNSDTANLETALSARSRPRGGDDPLHVVLRIDDLSFGRSIKRHFGVSSFSTTELTAATIAGLARFESTRGRFQIAGDDGATRSFQVAERIQGAENAAPPAPPERPDYRVRWIPLYVWRDAAGGKGEAIPIHKFAGEVATGDRLLFLVPLDQFADDRAD